MAAFPLSLSEHARTVQGFSAQEVSDGTYEQVTCLACQRVHFVNLRTGKVLGEDDDE